MSIEATSPGDVLVVIPTLNEARHIDEVIGALECDLPQDRGVTFVVADGGSTDGTLARVQALQASRPWLHVLANPKRIQSSALNLAVARFGAQAEVLIRCDAHAGYPRGFVRRLVQSLEQHGADAVVVPMDSQGERCFQRAVAWVSDSRLGSGGSAHRGGRVSGFVDHGHHAAFRMASFRRAGGYDESFTHNEDAELDCRQRRMGSRLYLDADIRLTYAPRATPWQLARQYFAYGRGRSRTVRRHPGSMRLRQLALPVHLVLLCITLLAAVWWPQALIWPLCYALVLVLSAVGIARRERSWCGLWAAPAAAIMHLAWASGFLTGLAVTRERRWEASEAGAWHTQTRH